MNIIHPHGRGSNGNLPARDPTGPGRTAAVATATSPRAADILGPERLASIRGESGPSPLMKRVLSAAHELAANEAECTLLTRTRLLDVDGEHFRVAFPTLAYVPGERERLRSLFNQCLARVGLDCHNVHFVSGHGA